MDNLDDYQNARKAAADRRRKRRAAKEKVVINRAPTSWWRRVLLRVGMVLTVALLRFHSSGTRFLPL